VYILYISRFFILYSDFLWQIHMMTISTDDDDFKFDFAHCLADLCSWKNSRPPWDGGCPVAWRV